MAVVMGTAAGGRREAIRFQRDVLLGNGNRAAAMRRFPRSQMLNASYHAQANRVASEFGFRRPNVTISTACASGTNAVALGADLVRFGRADVALAGGSELLCQIVFTGFAVIRAMSENGRISPFDGVSGLSAVGYALDLLRDGRADFILASGADIFGEPILRAVGRPDHDPTGAGVARAIRAALADAGRDVPDVDHVAASANSSPRGDLTEARGIRTALGARADAVPVSSVKGVTGETFSAGGVLALVQAAVAADIPLGCVPRTALDRPVRVALANSICPTGNNAIAVLVAP